MSKVGSLDTPKNGLGPRRNCAVLGYPRCSGHRDAAGGPLAVALAAGALRLGSPRQSGHGGEVEGREVGVWRRRPRACRHLKSCKDGPSRSGG